MRFKYTMAIHDSPGEEMVKRVVCAIAVSFCLSMIAIGSSSIRTEAITEGGWGIPKLADGGLGTASGQDLPMDSARDAGAICHQDYTPLGDDCDGGRAGGYSAQAWADPYAANDSEDPSTSAICSGTEGENGWYVSPVELELDAVDTISGVNWTLYRLVDEDWEEYTEPIELTEDGIHTYEFYSEDLAGNTEEVKNISVHIDVTAPEAWATVQSGEVSFFAKDESWYCSLVEIGISASDDTSGVCCINYSIDENEWQTYESAITILSDGEHSIDYLAIDMAGNACGSERDYVKIDKYFGYLAITSIGRGETITSTSHLLTWTCFEQHSGVYDFSVRVDGVTTKYNSSVREALISHLSEGHHEIQLMAMDNAGNFAFSIVDFYVKDTGLLTLKLLAIFAVGAAVIVVTALALLRWVR